MKHSAIYIFAIVALFNSEANANPINLLPNVTVEREMWMNIAREDDNIWSIRVDDIPTTPIAEPAMWVRVTNDRGDGSQRLVAFDCSSGRARELQRVETVAGFRRTANYGAEPVAVAPGTPMARALALACDAHGWHGHHACSARVPPCFALPLGARRAAEFCTMQEDARAPCQTITPT